MRLVLSLAANGPKLVVRVAERRDEERLLAGVEALGGPMRTQITERLWAEAWTSAFTPTAHALAIESLGDADDRLDVLCEVLGRARSSVTIKPRGWMGYGSPRRGLTAGAGRSRGMHVVICIAGLGLAKTADEDHAAAVVGERHIRSALWRWSLIDDGMRLIELEAPGDEHDQRLPNQRRVSRSRVAQRGWRRRGDLTCSRHVDEARASRAVGALS